MPAPTPVVPAALVEEYVTAGYWSDRALADHVATHAIERPSDTALIDGSERLTWSEYHERSDDLAAVLCAAGLEPGAMVGVLLPDTCVVHVVYLACEKAGLTVVGIGPKAGDREVAHLLRRTGARALVTHAARRDRPVDQLLAALREQEVDVGTVVVVPSTGHSHLPVFVNGSVLVPGSGYRQGTEHRRLGPNDCFLLNSTSGTTGLPKCVVQHQNRWWFFHQLAADAGELSSDDIFMSAIPAPFGFGLWTAHFTPAFVGAPVVVVPRFDVESALSTIEREHVTVLACVSTQFIMMLSSPTLAQRDLSTLRVMFTGGEAVPHAAAERFEDMTGATILQFFGSNETGALSRTTLLDDREHRLGTAGRIIPEMNVQLFDEHGQVIREPGRPGQPGCRGPATSPGYYDDDEANRQLVTGDGWMLTGDIAEIDDDGYLRVVGRASDFIIRGGKNISAAEVEEEVGTHPHVRLAAAVAMPDEVFGERVCVFVELVIDEKLTLDELCDHLLRRGVSKELLPERLEVVAELPRSSGGKVAKGELRARLA